MKRVFAFLLAMIVAILPAAGALSEEVDVFISTGELILDKDNSNTGDSELDAKFVKEAEAAGFVNLKGHRTVGGMRASIYNAMPIEGVEKLVAFMQEFEKSHS